jgi:hypothetical protein
MRVLALAVASLLVLACGSSEPRDPVSASGVRKANVTVQTNANGHTVEQDAYAERLKRDNAPGSIKHLYVISAYSGQVIIYSTVKGKVTSSGKRLTPSSVSGIYGASSYGFPVMIGDDQYYTTEVLGDDGTYGSSIPYIYWFDTKGVYHQHYPDGGQIIHISDQPLRVPSIILNMETNTITSKP